MYVVLLVIAWLLFWAGVTRSSTATYAGRVGQISRSVSCLISHRRWLMNFGRGLIASERPFGNAPRP
jgi:hypothetical protein